MQKMNLVMEKKFIAYYRVSTKRQNLGLDAQKRTVNEYLNINGGILLNSFEEKESGKNNNRIQLSCAIEECKRNNATLIIAKLDRLSRNIGFIFALRDSNVDFVCCDIPSCNTLSLGIYATIAQNERELISQRTKLALRAKKDKGFKLGAPNAEFTKEMRIKACKANSAKAQHNTNNIRATSMIVSLLRTTNNLSEIARELNANAFTTSRGCKFTAIQVKRLINRLNID